MEKSRRRVEPTVGSSDTPVIVASHAAHGPGAAEVESRPAGLTVIAVLVIAAGLGALGLQILFSEQLTAALQSIGVAPQLAGIQLIVFGLVAIAAGLLVFDANRWGWMLLIALLSYELFNSAQAVLASYETGVELALLQGATLSPYAKLFGRIALELALAGYLVRRAVREYFALVQPQAAALFAIALALAAAATGALWFVSRGLPNSG